MRLIDADALMENYNLKDATKYGNKNEKQQEHSYDTMYMYEIADMIEDAPTIEAVPVVRCKDCMYYNLFRLECRSPHLNGYTPIDGYCHNGRKKV